MRLFEEHWSAAPNGPTSISELLSQLKDPETTRKAISEVARHRITDESVVNVLVELLSDEEFFVKQDVIEVLGNLGVKNEIAISALCNMLALDCGEVAAAALRKIGVKNQEVTSALTRELDNASMDKKALLLSLWSLGERTQRVLNEIARLDPEDLAEIVQECDMKSKQLTDVMIRLVHENPYLVRTPPANIKAAESLRFTAEPGDKETIGVLERLLSDKYNGVAVQAALSLCKLNYEKKEKLLPLLFQALQAEQYKTPLEELDYFQEDGLRKQVAEAIFALLE